MRLRAATITFRLPVTVIAALLLLFVVLSPMAFDVAAAAVPSGPTLQSEPTATPAASVAVPSPVGSSEVPAPQNTAPATITPLPNPEETRQAQVAEATAAASRPTATIDTSISPSDAAPPPGTNNSGSGNTPGSTAGSDSLPWLPLILFGAALLGVILYLMSRRRTPAVVAVQPRPGPMADAAPYGASSPAASTVTSPAPQPVTPPVATTTTATTTAAVVPPPFVPPTAMPSTIDCPNCGISNGFNENFCHDCGQDLRPTRAALLAAAAPPPDVVTETTPYLETVSRIDEQLEYVLSRPRVLIGTAPGSDIVIDSLFQGWQTVDPVHAELRRESEGFVLVDRGSGSGTFVNEMRTGENLLSDGDVIRVGDVQFVFRVPA